MVFAFEPFRRLLQRDPLRHGRRRGNAAAHLSARHRGDLDGGPFLGLRFLAREDGRLVRAPRDATHPAARWGLAPGGARRQRGHHGVRVGARALADAGHHCTRAWRQKRAARACDAVYPDDVREEDAALFGAPTARRRWRARSMCWGRAGPQRITAFFLPRRRGEEAPDGGRGHLHRQALAARKFTCQMHGYPHPVLGHERSRTWWAGSFGARPPSASPEHGGGLLPNPGWIEGVAVAASPSEDELTGEMWARGHDGSRHPAQRAGPVFSLDFLGQSAAKSYTVAGAFRRPG